MRIIYRVRNLTRYAQVLKRGTCRRFKELRESVRHLKHLIIISGYCVVGTDLLDRVAFTKAGSRVTCCDPE